MTIFQVDIACIEKKCSCSVFSLVQFNKRSYTHSISLRFFILFSSSLLYFVVCCFISYTENDIEICSIREWKVFLRFITFFSLYICCSVRKCRSKVSSHNRMFNISIKTGNARRKTAHSIIYKHEHWTINIPMSFYSIFSRPINIIQ